jgi:hypothetical protein
MQNRSIDPPDDGRAARLGLPHPAIRLHHRPHTTFRNFRIEESSSYLLVTDALAERVLQTGCSGMQFTDPHSPQLGQRIECQRIEGQRIEGQRIERYRTATGIAERRMHF